MLIVTSTSFFVTIPSIPLQDMFPSSEPYEFSSGVWYSNLNVESITE